MLLTLDIENTDLRQRGCHAGEAKRSAADMTRQSSVFENIFGEVNFSIIFQNCILSKNCPKIYWIEIEEEEKHLN